jgi:hypothetical protein
MVPDILLAVVVALYTLITARFIVSSIQTQRKVGRRTGCGLRVLPRPRGPCGGPYVPQINDFQTATNVPRHAHAKFHRHAHAPSACGLAQPRCSRPGAPAVLQHPQRQLKGPWDEPLVKLNTGELLASCLSPGGFIEGRSGGTRGRRRILLAVVGALYTLVTARLMLVFQSAAVGGRGGRTRRLPRLPELLTHTYVHPYPSSSFVPQLWATAAAARNEPARVKRLEDHAEEVVADPLAQKRKVGRVWLSCTL